MENQLQENSERYGLSAWGHPYFRINSAGHIDVTPLGENGPRIDLYELTRDLLDRGMRVPIMIRVPDILKDRVCRINECFQKAFSEHSYRGRYRGVYPIKVNQQRHLVEELLKHGHPFGLGLEAGSKPELLVVLSMLDHPDALIVCNGFKDSEYIETALLSQKLGKYTIIVVDRFEEIDLIIQGARKHGIRPHIGFRVKLNSQGAGRWVDSSGAKSKFGLTTLEVAQGIQKLREAELLDCLELIHFHIGSQIPKIQNIKASLKEGVRFFTEVYRMGATNLRFIDVGGGLGVDYDGSGSSDVSINYSVQEYANDIVSALQIACDEKQIPHPDIITESGRYLVAHHSVLVFNVTGHNNLLRLEPPARATRSDHQVMQDLQYIFDRLSEKNLNESFNDLQQLRGEFLQLFVYGVLTLEQRAWCEAMFFAIANKMLGIAAQSEDFEHIRSSLYSELCDTYFCNFSVFQSIPDLWAVDQVFPVMPIHRLDEKPSVYATLADLTCDSDGKMDKFIDLSQSSGYRSTLPVHPLRAGEPYFMAIFLTGAYQEILGDLHNLFGDTDAVHVTITDKGYMLDHYIPGDTVTEVLSYVQYLQLNLIEKIRRFAEESVQRGLATKQDVKMLLKFYEEGLSGYTYLEDGL